MNNDSMDPEQIRTLAQQLAQRLIAMRQTHHNPIQHPGSHLSDIPQSQTEMIPTTSSDTNISQLTFQLNSLQTQDGLINQTPPSPSLTSIATDPTIKEVQVNTDADQYASVPDPSVYEMDFINTYLRTNALVLAFEETQLLEHACEQIPIDKLVNEAEAMVKDYPNDSTDDIIIRRLLHWFKNEYFTWVNEPPCASCQGKTVAMGHTTPTAQERQDGAGIVETYRCTQACPTITRFPRYGMPRILFSTRRGRCGEWANVKED
ncbi:peptide-N4-(N-acetyl-beta- glucosaminyl)asparagine amidase [Lobosporangium transversale]|nr:peptide-N4-(N-acetyl-beta- glucosaminyl)asparagine amidase [Lobosporangium transversale]